MCGLAEEPEGPVERHPVVLQDVHQTALGAVLEEDVHAARLHGAEEKAADVGVIQTPATKHTCSNITGNSNTCNDSICDSVW